jgi:hypothetical protein
MGNRKMTKIVLKETRNGDVRTDIEGETGKIIGTLIAALAKVMLDIRKPGAAPGRLADRVRAWVLEAMLAQLEGEE